MVRALLIDDDVELAELLTAYFEGHGLVLTHAVDGPRGLEALAAGAFDVVLLDVMLPGFDGFEVCRRIRASAFAHVPVVMLTARGDDDDRIVGLELGADDYVPKPFNPRELLARMRAVLRRTAKGAQPDRLEVGPLAIDLGARTVSLRGQDVVLTAHEYRILLVLARRAGETITREELAEGAREPAQVKAEAYDPTVDRALDVHVSRLRQKLEDDPKEPRLIKTVRGVGYVLARPS